MVLLLARYLVHEQDTHFCDLESYLARDILQTNEILFLGLEPSGINLKLSGCMYNVLCLV